VGQIPFQFSAGTPRLNNNFWKYRPVKAPARIYLYCAGAIFINKNKKVLDIGCLTFLSINPFLQKKEGDHFKLVAPNCSAVVTILFANGEKSTVSI